ncbi:cell wall hydrolase [Paenibacillus dakarensis]|uniref:cell wall hydrolase n=1 Tax=Paenibacillus dakarensis TaxID=1527293 RepID=UPI0006D57AC0|nr:cell wall hydrolase [Paenibacillus dakarensis]
MNSKIIRQNRWVTLLLGVLFVSLSLISLLGMQTNVSKGEGTEQHVPQETAALPKSEDPAKERIAAEIDERVLLASQASINYKKWKNKDEIKLSIHHPRLKGNDYAKENANRTSKNKSMSAAQKKPANETKPKKNEGTNTVKSQAKGLQPPATLFFTRTETLTQDQKEKATWEYALSAEELLILQKIVMAEAEGEPYEGKVAVANVVLNRLRSANFPDTIKKVIYQKYQFSPVGNGRINRVKPNKETIKAVNAALNGHKAVSDDTYFFLSLKLAQDLTVHHSRTFSKKIGNHSFYK